MTARRMHTLIPPADDAERARRDDCAAADHPPATYNPWAGETWCPCGVARYPGNQTPPRSPVAERWAPSAIESALTPAVVPLGQGPEPDDGEPALFGLDEAGR